MNGSWWRVLTKRGLMEKGMANHFSILALRTPWIVWKGKKIGHWKMNSPGWQVPNMLLEISGEITPEEWRNKAKAKQCLVVDVTCNGNKVWCCKEHYCIGNWKVRSLNQGKEEVVKQEMARGSISFRNFRNLILGISELKWTGMDEFNSDTQGIIICNMVMWLKN